MLAELRIVDLGVIGEASIELSPGFTAVTGETGAGKTMIVTGLALLVFLVPPLAWGGGWSDWLYRACVLLIIACPCALVIATPVSIVAGLTALARRGVLIKGGAHLESIGRLAALAVDKTGTITEGKPRVQSVEPLGAASEAEVLRLAAAVDVHSSHPLARAVVEHAAARGVAFPRAGQYQARPGRGAQGTVDGHPYFVGNHRFTHELGICSEDIERRLAAGIKSTGGRVRLHICGNTRKLLPLMGQVGADLVDLDSPSPLDEARAAMGPTQVLLGNLDPVRTLRDGTPETVTAAISHCYAGAGPCFIVGAGCEIARGTPEANVHALVEFARRHVPGQG